MTDPRTDTSEPGTLYERMKRIAEQAGPAKSDTSEPVEVIAAAVHRGRYKPGQTPEPFSEERADGQEYCRRIAASVLEELDRHRLHHSASMPAFDITKPITPDQDGALAVDVLDRFARAAGPFSPGDARRVIETIQRLRKHSVAPPAPAPRDEVRTEVERLREALEPFARVADRIAAERPGWDHDDFTFGMAWPAITFRMGDFRRAAALAANLGTCNGRCPADAL